LETARPNGCISCRWMKAISSDAAALTAGQLDGESVGS
jgi:hypothetical protein